MCAGGIQVSGTKPAELRWVYCTTPNPQISKLAPFLLTDERVKRRSWSMWAAWPDMVHFFVFAGASLEHLALPVSTRRGGRYALLVRITERDGNSGIMY